MRAKGLILGVVAVGALAAGALVPIGPTGQVSQAASPRKPGDVMDLSSFSADKPSQPLRLLFIHHSCGGQLLAPVGPDVGEACIYKSHPNGGNLRPMLEEQGYEVHEASYNSLVGDKTDMFDWLPKFRDHMDKVLTCDRQDRFYTDGRKNQIVMFKACYPNSNFRGEGQPPGDPKGPEINLWNAKATMMAVRDELAKHPEVLFVHVTAPPLSQVVPPEPAWRWVAKKLTGKLWTPESLARSHAIARQFNDWLKSPSGWLAGYPHKNIVVFDYFDELTDNGLSDNLRYPTGDGSDSHPSSAGNQKAARAFAPFLNRAVRRAGLSQ